jgi:hypothetical protein
MIDSQQLKPAQEDIRAFIDWVLDFLERLQSGNVRTADGLLFDANALMVYRDAWPGFEEDFQSSGWRDRVGNAEPAQLQAHGLYGSQLWVKLWMVSYLLQRFLATLPEEERQRLSVLPRWNSRALAPQVASHPGDKPKGLLKRLIETIDIPLDSIVAALGLNGSITEVKKLLGVSIDD